MTDAVCLVDDDPSVLKATGRLLTSAGWEVKTFDDPSAFLSFARTEQPRVAVIDIWMPQMHGLEVQTRLREVSPFTQVIILTARDDPFVRAKALAAGACAFFIKPEHDEDFLGGIAAAFSQN